MSLENWRQSWKSVANTSVEAPPAGPAVGRRMKRRRTKRLKNKQDIEMQRMTHITVERNRRKQMNHYLSVLRSSMPPSYSQRGDQASIVGGAINFVKELEQLFHRLEANKQIKQQQNHEDRRLADIQVTMVDSHANIKLVMSRKQPQPKQLSKLVSGFHSLALSILHLNVTTLVDHTIIYSFNVKVEDDCGLTSVNEIASTVHKMVSRIQEDATIIS